MSRASGRHSIKFGGEYRHFINENFAEGTGVFNFPSVAAFLTGTANAFNTTLGERSSVIDQRAVGLFVQDQITVRDRLTLDLGMRYEWHVTPTERDNRFIVFDAAARVAGPRRRRRRRDLRAEQPELRTSRRRRVAGLVRRPHGRCAPRMRGRSTSRERPRSGTRRAIRPIGMPLTAAGVDSSGQRDRRRRGPPGSRRPPPIRDYRNASVQSWNVNLQRQLARELAVTVGYLGSHGSNLRISRNINQPVNGVRPFAAAVGRQPDSARSPARQHHASGEQRVFELRRRVGVGDQAPVARAPVRDVVHVVEIARHQFAQFVRLRGSERLRHRRTSTARRISTRATGSS